MVFGNTTPKVGEGPSSKLPPEPAHVKNLLQEVNPGVVVAVGLQAEGVLRELWAGDLLCLPHPANRVLTNALLDRARELLERPFRGRLALRQLRGSVLEEHLVVDIAR